MARRRRPYEIHPRAWRLWEELPVPLLLDDVVDALLARPPEARVEGHVYIPVIRLDTLEGDVLGGRLRMTGIRGAQGRWEVIFKVVPL